MSTRKRQAKGRAWHTPDDVRHREVVNRTCGLRNSAGAAVAEGAMKWLDSQIETWWDEADAIERLQQLINERKGGTST